MPRAAPDAPLPDPSKNMAAADSDLAGRIESALNAETSLHGSRIGVIAANGVVTLTGSTRSPDLRSVASHIALSVDGVRLVRNELAIGMET
jgi:osmotically-inducible protein OsmY